MNFYYNYIWEQGFRDQNEDALGIKQVTKDGISYLLAVVCDGIGGLEEGENASSFVVNQMMEEMMHLLRKENQGYRKDYKKIKCAFYRQIYRCHQILKEYGREKRIRLGTTISMIFVVKNKGCLLQIGDSSIFMGKRYLKRITKVQQNDEGALVQAIGVGKMPKVTCQRFRIKKGGIILLATDGFYKKSEKKICDKRWVDTLSYEEKKLGKSLLEVADYVQEQGERDNISAIIIRTK